MKKLGLGLHMVVAPGTRTRLTGERITIEPTADLDLVSSILTQRKVWHRMADDFAPAREDFTAVEHPKVQYVLAKSAGEPAGVFVLIHLSPVLCEVHFSFLPGAWGMTARKCTHAFLSWLWEKTTYMRAIGNIPASNPLALQFAMELGFEPFGRNLKSFQKHGKLIDEIWVGISRPDESPQAA